MSIRHPVCRLTFALMLFCVVFAVHADGTDDAAAARKTCQTQMGADTSEKLRACCADQILTDPLSKQRRLEKECVSGIEQPKSSAEIAADERAKAAAGGSATPAVATAAAAKPTVTDVVNKCNSSQTHQALSSLGSLARRLGPKVPNTDCP